MELNRAAKDTIHVASSLDKVMSIRLTVTKSQKKKNSNQYETIQTYLVNLVISIIYKIDNLTKHMVMGKYMKSKYHFFPLPY